MGSEMCIRDRRGLIGSIAGKDRKPCPQGHDQALEMAIITGPEARDPDLLAKLDAVAGRVL